MVALKPSRRFGRLAAGFHEAIYVLPKNGIAQHMLDPVARGRLQDDPGLFVISQSFGSSCRHTSSVAWFQDQCMSKASSARESNPSISVAGGVHRMVCRNKFAHDLSSSDRVAARVR